MTSRHFVLKESDPVLPVIKEHPFSFPYHRRL